MRTQGFLRRERMEIMKDKYKTKTLMKEVPDEQPARDSLRKDMDASLRFLHFMGMQTKHDVIDVTSRLFALIEELVASGQLDRRSFEERWFRFREKEEARARGRAFVQVADHVDKYVLEDLPRIDCESRMSLCRARCCKLSFPLSFQDLDERTVQWDYSNPYQIRRKPDGYCVHNENGSMNCRVYANRPATCRTYDCRNDKRIWIDFERRIPSPDEENKSENR